MIIDCDHCAMQHTAACDDCVVGALLSGAPVVEMADVEVAAIDNLAEVGLVSPIRLVVRNADPDAAAG